MHLMAYDSAGAARANIAQYFDWYNTERPHSSLDRVTPKQVYDGLQPKLGGIATLTKYEVAPICKVLQIVPSTHHAAHDDQAGKTIF
jgi:hypothetical protein